MTEKLGPTGECPRGKVNPSDEGEIKIAVATHHSDKIVGIHFGKAVAWIGFDKASAKAFAKLIEQKADLLK